MLLLGVGLLGLGIHLGQKAASVQPSERRLEAASEEVRRLSLALEVERRKNQALNQKAQNLEEESQKLKRAIEELRKRAGLPPVGARAVRPKPQGGENRPLSPEEAWTFLKGEAQGLARALEEIRPALEQTLAREAARPVGVPLPCRRGVTSLLRHPEKPLWVWARVPRRGGFLRPLRDRRPGHGKRGGGPSWVDGGYGLAVEVDHGYSYRTLCGHLSRLKIRPRQRMSRGGILGRLGSTGRSTGPHLQYSVFRNGLPVDPGAYLQ